MIYIDSSSLLKLVVAEPESEAVRYAVAAENSIALSALVELEATVQLKGWFLAGKRSKRDYKKQCGIFDDLITESPFERAGLPGSVFQRALNQHRMAVVHCRSLDRLHLAAMEELGIKKLMTHDFRQAEAARERGMLVVMPGVR